jgi:hypothetical protein
MRGPTMVRKIVAAMSTARADLDVSIMPALKRMVAALTTGVGNTLTVDTGSMLEPIRRGFTSRTCTSLWERTAYGMQLHTAILL